MGGSSGETKSIVQITRAVVVHDGISNPVVLGSHGNVTWKTNLNTMRASAHSSQVYIIRKELRQRRRTFLEKSVSLEDELAHTDKGWEVAKRNKKTLRVRKPKPIDRQLEDDVWALFALMGFDDMSQGYDFKVPISDSRAGVPPKQIDVMAVDEETAVVVECKASETMRSRSLQKDLNETRGLQDAIRTAIHNHYEDRRRVCFLYVTRNIRWSRQDRERAKANQIAVIRDRQVDYYRRLVDIIGPAARHQLQADLLQGSPVPGLRTAVPALRGTFGNKPFYQFAIEPARLLKLAYVSHRTKIDAEAIGTYQRLLRKKRLKDIASHIDETGGIFPTNIVVNFRHSRGLRFDPAGPSTDDPTVLGTLHLPNTYKCAWIIDGQHRLYGFSLSEWTSKGRVPVLAFENLKPEEEVKMFVEINNKQVKVPRALLVELEPELQLTSSRPEQELRRLHSQLAVDLSESDDSPLWGRVASEWDTDTTNKPVTLPQLANAVEGSQLVGTVRSGVLYPGYLYSRDSQFTRDRVRLTIEKYLSLFSEGANEHWMKDSKAGGFLCTNLGISALLRVFRTILEYQRTGRDNLDFDKLSPDAIVGSVDMYVEPIIHWFNNQIDSDLATFKGRYGGGAPRMYSFALMEIVHRAIPQFDPPGLAEYIQEHSTETISYAQQSITEIEDAIRAITIAILRGRYGEESWWREGVPQDVRGQAAQRSELNVERGEPHQFLDLLDYKKIAEQPKHWREFENYWTIDRTLRSKSDKLDWMDRLSTIRNRAFHSGRRYVTNEEITFLEETWAHVGHERDKLKDRGLD